MKTKYKNYAISQKILNFVAVLFGEIGDNFTADLQYFARHVERHPAHHAQSEPLYSQFFLKNEPTNRNT